MHIHAVGPALLVPVAKMLGLKVVMTNHGPDYEREKWGKAAKAMLRLGERLGAKYADAVIVISEHIRRRLAERYGRTDADLIFNGVPVLERMRELIIQTLSVCSRGGMSWQSGVSSRKRTSISL